MSDHHTKSTLPERAGPAGPLSGVTVLDLSAYIAGPYGCTLLADQGARVIKIEPPDGDNLRKYPSTLEDESRAFIGINRSKLGVARSEEGGRVGRAVAPRAHRRRARAASVLACPSVSASTSISYRRSIRD